MRNYSWWLSKKKRVKKKYINFLGSYYSPKEAKEEAKEILQRRQRKNETD